MKKLKHSKFKFAPFSRKQKQVITWWRDGSPYSGHDGIIAEGSIRSGKTIAFIIGFVLWSTKCFTDENFIISGKSIGTLKRNIISPMLKILRALGIDFQYNRSENFLEFGGNTYYLFGGNNEASQDTLQGITAAGWLGDEVALQPQSFIEQAIGRCSVDGSRYWLNCNPESPRHYVKLEIIDQAKEKLFFHLHFTLDDNLALGEKIKERYRRMFSGLWFKRFILGLWVAAEGSIYDMFDESLHVVDSLPAGVDLVQYWVACDYGTTNPTVFLLIGLGSDGRYYVVDEYRYDSTEHSGRKKTPAQYADDLYAFIEKSGIHITTVFVDPAAAEFIQTIKGRVPVKGAKNEVVNGLLRVGSLFSSNRLIIFSRCKGLITELYSYVWDPKATERGEDAPLKINDHGPDALRYYCNEVAGKSVITSW